MPVIFCEINLGIMNQIVYLFSENNSKQIASVPVEDIGGTLAGLCYSCRVNSLKLKGPKPYLENVIDDIKTTESMLYGTNKIEIEVL